MKFNQVEVGKRFKLKDLEYLKIPEERISCCKIGANALLVSEHKKVVIMAKEEVEVVEDQ
jgi:hypothetical protein